METKGDRTENVHHPQTEQRHPDLWQQDLNPHHMAGQNVGDRETSLRTAYDVKPLHRGMSDLPDDELKGIPVLAEGERLQQGATYLDLNHPERGEFTAMGDMAAGPDNAYVPKDRVPYPTWNRLRGIDDPERL
ncbi:MAG TPA: hypothetical protein VHG28_08555 [Longimicrobiaceae bacterium]|nr:hypothetical protein [Longimicrobiaceae bacterium]